MFNYYFENVTKIMVEYFIIKNTIHEFQSEIKRKLTQFNQNEAY